MAGRRRFQLPDIFGFVSYAAWLNAAFDSLQEQEPSMTHRRFSEICGYKSSGAIALIASGRRRLSDQGARRISKALKLSVAEKEHLLLMVSFEQAEEFESRSKLLKKMSAAKRFAEQWDGTLRAFDFYTQWYLPVVRELVSLPDFVEDPVWVQRRMHFKLSRKEARDALHDLLKMGYLQRDSEGNLQQSVPIVATRSELQSDVLKQHQREMMRLASQALDSQPREQRDMRVMTVAISEAQAQKIKARLTLMQKELLEIVAEDDGVEGVYQLNTQWFALTDVADNAQQSPAKDQEEEG